MEPGHPRTPPPARVALVTGASGGIGRELAVGLARAGIAVGVHGRDAERLAATERAVADTGGRACAVTADVTRFDEVTDAVTAVEQALGPIDLLVNNAGLIEAGELPVWEADVAEWARVLEADLLGPFHCVRAVVPGMVSRGGGRVVNLNSGIGTRDSGVYSAYAAAKTGLFRISGALHEAGHDRGVRAFEVAPGVVETDMTRGMAMHEGRTEWTDPQDLVALVLAIAGGDLDAWSGRFVRAGADDPARLAQRAEQGLHDDARRLRLRPWGPDDPAR
jgi:NAD(P)-dependent dehydrogenase (short-subunit alcohol dehydrogenase family)